MLGEEEKQDRKYKKALAELSMACFIFLRQLDEVMKLPSEQQRGRFIANLANRLETANDSIRYSSLGVNFRTDNKDKVWKDIREGKK